MARHRDEPLPALRRRLVERIADVALTAMPVPHALPFPNNHFDLVLSGASLDRWHDQRRGVAELARVVRDNGTVVLIDLARPLHRRQPGRYRTRTELTKLLTDAGLRVPGGSGHRLGPLAASGHAYVATR